MLPAIYGVSTYFLMWGLAAMVCSPTAVWLAERSGFARAKSVIAVVLLATALMLGSKVLFIADFEFSPIGDPRFARFPEGFAALLAHGFRIPGGFILMALSLVLICPLLNLPTLRFADAVAPAAGLMMFFTRLGCFLNGCCFGPVRSDSLFAMRFPPGSRVFEWQVQTGLLKQLGPTLPVIPLQLYFAALGLALFIAGVYWQRLRLYPGSIWMRICAGYFVGTLALEWMRVPSYPVNISVTAVALVVTLVAWLALKRGGNRMNVLQRTKATIPSGKTLHTGLRIPALIVLTCLSALLWNPASGRAAELSASGTWSADGEASSGTWSSHFFVGGADVNGDFKIDNFSALASGSVSGTLVGSELKFGVVARNREVGTENPIAATFTGTVEGATVRGVYTATDGSTGTWHGTFVPATPTPEGTEAP
jgi:phosphatidylglycerol:prolipoprotein diacylglycerol transferase